MTDEDRDTLSNYKISQLERAVAKIEADNSALHREISEMKRADAIKEKQLLLVGVTTLGGIVMTLFGVLWAYRSVIFK